jgi:rubrerythrin
MDLTKFETEELLLVAIKSEIESERIYTKTEERVKNAFLRERFRFLAGEEKNHRAFLEGFYKKQFGDKKIIIPETSEVPLPDIKIDTENDPISKILEQSMKAELAAKEFYKALSLKFSDKKTINMLELLSKMEDEHYRILSTEHNNALLFEDYDETWPNMHMGA